MATIIDKLRKSLAINGLGGTLRLAGDVALRYLLWFTPARIRQRAEFRRSDLAFDQQWGVDTSGISLPGEKEVVGQNWKYGTRYQGCDADVFSELLESLAIDYRDYTFIDMGSGKGRAVLLASRFPFRAVVGVEFSAQLNQVAERNLSIFPKTEIQCKNVSVVCADASRYDLPGGNIVLFLNNPFGTQVMQQVVANVSDSYRKDPRRIVVVYMTAYFPELWHQASFLTEIRCDWIAVFDSEPNAIPKQDVEKISCTQQE